MRTLVWLLVVLPAVAQESRPPDDPAALLPYSAPIFAEVTEPGRAATVIRGADVLARTLEPAVRKELDALLDEFIALGVRRAAFAYMPAIVFDNRWILVADADDPAPIAALIERRLPPSKERPPPVTATMPPFVVVADGAPTIAAARAILAGKGRPITGRPDFKRFRTRTAGAGLALHLDVAKIAPAWARALAKRNDDIGAVLFAHHLDHTARTARTLSVAFTLEGDAVLEAHAEIDPIPKATAFTETRPTHTVLAPTAGAGLVATLPRELLLFWNAREQLLSSKARAPLAEFQNNASILLGGLAVEDLFAAVGTSFDLYVGPGDPKAPDGYRYPSAALVGVVSDAAMKTSLLLTFQTTIGIVNAQRSMEGQPRFFQESLLHRDVLIAAARLLPETLADPDDPRLQLEPAFAVVKDRLILGTNRRIVRDLVDRALDGQTVPRQSGDDAVLFGPEAAALVRAAAAYLRAGRSMEHGSSAETAGRFVETLAALLARIEHGHAQFDVEGGLATLRVRAQGKDLLRKAPESR